MIVVETGRRKARTKHFDVRYFWITDKIKDDTFKILSCLSKDMLTDIFRKPTGVILYTSPHKTTQYQRRAAQLIIQTKYKCKH